MGVGSEPAASGAYYERCLCDERKLLGWTVICGFFMSGHSDDYTRPVLLLQRVQQGQLALESVSGCRFFDGRYKVEPDNFALDCPFYV